jgi:hypothetical protein
MYSIIVTAAIFIGMIFNDVMQNQSNRVSSHAFLGALATGLVAILWYLNYEMVGWGLITLPIAALIISYIVVVTGKGAVTALTSPASTAGPVLPNSPATPAPACIPSNLAGPYTAIAPPPPSTVSLPAVPPTPSTPAMSTNTPTPSSTITPLTGC